MVIEGESQMKDEERESGNLNKTLERVKEWVLSLKDWTIDRLSSNTVYVKNSIEIGTAELPAGITLYDQVTKEPHCLVLRDGKIETMSGACQ